jgi:hypothetical protein
LTICLFDYFVDWDQWRNNFFENSVANELTEKFQ